jgi:hypothetical protein
VEDVNGNEEDADVRMGESHHQVAFQKAKNAANRSRRRTAAPERKHNVTRQNNWERMEKQQDVLRV